MEEKKRRNLQNLPALEWNRICKFEQSDDGVEWISRIPNTIEDRYNPFEKYSQKGVRQKDSLHLKFSSLDPDNLEQIKGFCNDWGLLGLFIHEYTQYYLPSRLQTLIRPILEELGEDTNDIILFAPRSGIDLEELEDVAEKFKIPVDIVNSKSNFVNVSGDSEKIEDIKSEIIYFKQLFSLIEAVNAKDYEGIKKNVSYSQGMTNDQILECGQNDISLRLASMLNKNATPVVKWEDGVPVLKWHSNTLIGSLYIMVMLDLANNVNFRKCESKTCSTWFTYTTDYGGRDTVYCSPKCQRKHSNDKFKNENEEEIQIYRKEYYEKNKQKLKEKRKQKIINNRKGVVENG